MAVAIWVDHRLWKSSNDGLQLRKALSGGLDKFWTEARSGRAVTGFGAKPSDYPKQRRSAGHPIEPFISVVVKGRSFCT